MPARVDEHVEPAGSRSTGDGRVQLRRVVGRRSRPAERRTSEASSRTSGRDARAVETLDGRGGADAARASGDERDATGRSRTWSGRPAIPIRFLARWAFDPSRDYPLGTRRPDLVETPGGMPLEVADAARRPRHRAPSCAPRLRRCGCQAASRRPPGARSSPTTCARAARAGAACRTRRSWRSTPRSGRTARRPPSWRPGRTSSRAGTRRRPPPSCARRHRSTPSAACWLAG